MSALARLVARRFGIEHCLGIAKGLGLARRPLAAHLATGLAGEDFARRQLHASGWRTIGRRVATPFGEIDLVMARGRELAGVEVKTSSRVGTGGNERWTPACRFRAESVRRQARAARFVAAELRWAGTVEVALFEVWIGSDGRARGRLHRRYNGLRSGP